MLKKLGTYYEIGMADTANPALPTCLTLVDYGFKFMNELQKFIQTLVGIKLSNQYLRQFLLTKLLNIGNVKCSHTE